MDYVYCTVNKVQQRSWYLAVNYVYRTVNKVQQRSWYFAVDFVYSTVNTIQQRTLVGTWLWIMFTVQ